MARRSLTTRDEIEDEMIDVTPDDIEGGVDAERTKTLEDQKNLEDEIRSELGSPATDEVRYKVTVERVPVNGKGFVWLFDRPGESVDGIKEQLAENYGTGTYVARVYRILPGKGARQKEYHTIRIEMPKAAAPLPPAPPASEGALAAAVKQQGEILGQLVGQLAVIKAAPPAPSFDVEKIVGLVSAVGGAMKIFRDMIPAPPPPVDPMKSLATAMEIMREMGPGGEQRETNFLDIVGGFLKSPVFESAVQSAMQQQAAQPQMVAPQPARPQLTNTPPNAQRPPQPVPPQPAQDPTQNFLIYLGMAVKAAAKNSDPVSYADVIADQVDPAILQTLLGLPDPVAALAQYNPAVATYREWFAQLIDALTNPDEGVDDESASPLVAFPAHATGTPDPSLNAHVAPGGSGGSEADAQADEPSY